MPFDLTPLAPLRFAKFSFLLEAAEELHLPEYKGSTFRGGFGNALKKAVCMTRTYDCPPCLLQQACPYISIFEPKVNKSVADLLRIGRDAPNPFILEPPLTVQREFKQGELFTTNLVLIGKGIDMLPYFIYAFKLFGENLGLGTARGKFSLRRVTDSEGNCVYNDETKKLQNSFRELTFSGVTNGLNSTPRIGLNFVTPTRIMTSHNGGVRRLMRLRNVEDFWTLMETLYHRLFALSSLYCGAGAMDYRGHRLPLNSRRISLAGVNIRWEDWKRNSHRQKTEMHLGGFMGEATIEGELGDLIPLLQMGEHLHVGKNTSFGLGKYELR